MSDNTSVPEKTTQFASTEAYAVYREIVDSCLTKITYPDGSVHVGIKSDAIQIIDRALNHRPQGKPDLAERAKLYAAVVEAAKRWSYSSIRGGQADEDLVNALAALLNLGE